MIRVAPGLALVLLWALAGWVGPTSDISINDLPVYERYAGLLRDGLVPYHDFALEYPPLALLPMWLPSLLGDAGEAYELAFAMVMLAAALAVQICAAELAPPGRATLVAWLCALMPLLAGAMVRTHFDLAAIALAVGGVLALARGRPALGGALLAAGTMTKLFPILLAVVALGWLLGAGRRRAALRGAAAFGAVCIVVLAPFAGEGLLDAARFHLDRPVQIESVPATLLIALDSGDVTGAPWAPDRFNSNGIEGGAAGAVAWLCAALLVAAVAAATLGAARRPAPDVGGLAVASFAALLAATAFGKVLSPQFMIWLVPFAAVAWAHRARAAAAAAALAVVVTQFEFPSRYRKLVALDTEVVVLVGVRNALLLVALAAALTSLLGRGAAPARSRRLAAAPTR